MRNIVVHQVVQARGEANRIELLVVRGVAFGLKQLEVSVRGDRGSPTKVRVETAPDGEFRATFDNGTALRDAGCVCGATVHARVADANDPEGCYSSIETRLVCNSPERIA
jgi:hypothetical protein